VALIEVRGRETKRLDGMMSTSASSLRLETQMIWKSEVPGHAGTRWLTSYGKSMLTPDPPTIIQDPKVSNEFCVPNCLTFVWPLAMTVGLGAVAE
jgi:hypothetical protein